MEWNRIVPGLKEAAARAMDYYNWIPVRTLLEGTIVKGSVEYTQLQQIHAIDNIIKESCSRGFTELLSVFLNSGFPVNYIVNGSSETMLHLAACYGHLSLVKLLLNFGADIDCKTCNCKTPLYWAIENGHLEVVKHLISAGADINTSKYDGMLLQAALRSNNVTEELVQLLLDSGCDPNKSFSWSPLYCAVRTNNVKYVKMLLEAGAHVTINCTDDISLHSAAWFGNISVMDLLLKYGADINAKNHLGDTALHRAVGSGNLQSVKFLIEHGSQINSLNNSKQTPLLASFNARSFDVALLLIKSGADHYQMLHRAISSTAPVELIECLLEHGASVTTVHHNKTALQHVISNRNYSNDMKIHLAKLLLIYESDHYVQDYQLNTLLHWACRMGDVELVEYLIYYGLNVDAKNIEGKKPYDIATEKGHTNIVKAIIHYHCNKYMRF